MPWAGDQKENVEQGGINTTSFIAVFGDDVMISNVTGTVHHIDIFSTLLLTPDNQTGKTS